MPDAGLGDIDPPARFPLMPITFREEVDGEIRGVRLDAEFILVLERCPVERTVLRAPSIRPFVVVPHLDLVQPDGEEIVLPPTMRLPLSHFAADRHLLFSGGVPTRSGKASGCPSRRHDLLWGLPSCPLRPRALKDARHAVGLPLVAVYAALAADRRSRPRSAVIRQGGRSSHALLVQGRCSPKMVEAYPHGRLDPLGGSRQHPSPFGSPRPSSGPLTPGLSMARSRPGPPAGAMLAFASASMECLDARAGRGRTADVGRRGSPCSLCARAWHPAGASRRFGMERRRRPMGSAGLKRIRWVQALPRPGIVGELNDRGRHPRAGSMGGLGRRLGLTSAVSVAGRSSESGWKA